MTITTGNAFDIVADVYSISRLNLDKKGSYRANMNITITNHKDTPSEIQIKILKSYGDNLVIDWDSMNTAAV